MAVPCPTSITSARKWSGAINSRAGNIRGSHKNTPSQRHGNPRGNNSHSVPTSASNTAQIDGDGKVHTAKCCAASQLKPSPSAAMIRSAQIRQNGNATPINAKGVTSQLTTGIAIALASGDTSETCWNSNSKAGASASVTAVCTLTHAESFELSPVRPTVTHRIAAIAPNESQKPGANTAHGSSSNTPNKAHASATVGRVSR